MRPAAIVAIGGLVGAAVLWAAMRMPALPDEAYYWTWSRAPALAYLDHPPGVAWVLAVSTALFGDGLAALRVPSIVSLAGAAALTVIAARELAEPGQERRAGELAFLAFLGAPVLSIACIPLTPDPLLAFALALAALSLTCALKCAPGGVILFPARLKKCAPGGVIPFPAPEMELRRQAPISAVRSGEMELRRQAPIPWEMELRRLAPISAGAVVAGAALIKHSGGLVAIGVLGGLLATRAGRRFLRRPAPWVGAVGASVVVVAWLRADLAHDGGSFAFQLVRVFPGTPLALLSLPFTLALLLGTFGPVTALALIRELARLVLPRPRPRPRPEALDDWRRAAHVALLGGAAAVLIAFLVAAWNGSGEANWPLPALSIALPPISAAVAGGRFERAFAAGATACALLTVPILIHAGAPFFPLIRTHDPTWRGRGYDQIAKEAEALAAAHGARAIAARRYQVASMLRYHLRDRWPVLELGSREGRRSQYDRWPRPRVEAGDVLVMVGLGPELPSEIGAAPLPGAAPRTVERLGLHDGSPLETWWVTPIIAGRDAAGSEETSAARWP